MLSLSAQHECLDVVEITGVCLSLSSLFTTAPASVPEGLINVWAIFLILFVLMKAKPSGFSKTDETRTLSCARLAV
jgi:hypothetical protein